MIYEVAFCAVTSVSRLAFARVLAASVNRVYPGLRLAVLLFDDTQHFVDAATEQFDVVTPAELDIDAAEFKRMAACYEAFELACALKPWIIRHQLDRGAQAVVYLDGDMLMLASLDQMAGEARDRGVALVPHTTEPLPDDGLRPIEAEFLRFGTYNGGCIGVGDSHEGRAFLDWWMGRLRRDCIHSDDEGLFLDQRWLDLVPALFNPAVVRDAGVDVAYWNRAGALQRTGDDYVLAAGEPLRLFHFSGFDPRMPGQLSGLQPTAARAEPARNSALARLCADYAAAVLAAGHTELIDHPYGFGATADGFPLDRRMRRVFRAALKEAEAAIAEPPPNPFDPRESPMFLEWLNATPADARLSRYLGAVYDERCDVRGLFPVLAGTDRDHFLHWAREYGVPDAGIPAEMIPTPAPPVAGPPTGPRPIAGRLKLRLPRRPRP